MVFESVSEFCRNLQGVQARDAGARRNALAQLNPINEPTQPPPNPHSQPFRHDSTASRARGVLAIRNEIRGVLEIREMLAVCAVLRV